MMQLLWSPPSPYARKVTITAALKGLEERIERVLTDSAPADNASLRRDNPLAKIPTLVLENGTRIFDSHVICEYLDAVGSGPALFPKEVEARARTLTLAALGDGILDAALLLVYEKRLRPEEKWHAPWTERQWHKIDGALGWLEANAAAWSQWTGAPDYGHVTIACALGYLDLRHEGRWRAAHPRCVAWLDRFAAAVPAFAATKVTA
jgi:glutathione S-transferase